MGCYDTIVFHCPDCGKCLSTQSKGGDCVLGFFKHTEVPSDVASDCHRHTPVKCECGSSWMFNYPASVCLTLRKVD